ncbi:hypothetical protein C2G38_2169559 [Gigaspora rosea]|uniref:Uncharacterized protein n=1 Tax=Gigaspora rosea TaxID=44941 RepID=A0A397VRU1_9GLOM|nr:hypothetical protein C2G38_2169559 [Gigaspora rosea]
MDKQFKKFSLSGSSLELDILLPLDESLVIDLRIHDDDDKYLLASKEDAKILVACKFHPKKNIGFNDVERTASMSKQYNVQSVIVTNLNYSYKSKIKGKKLNRIKNEELAILDNILNINIDY